MKGLRITAIALVFMGAWSVQAHAGRSKVKVLGLNVESEHLSTKDKKDLFRVVQTRLRAYPKLQLLNPPEAELTDIMMDLECVDLDKDCLVKLGKKYRASRVVYTQVNKEKTGDYSLIVKVLHVRKKRYLRDGKTLVKSLSGLINALAADISSAFGVLKVKKPVVVKKKPVVVKKPVVLKKKPVVKKPVVKKPVVLKKKPVVVKKKPMRRSRLKVRSSVPGARIYFNGQYVGLGRVSKRVSPGVYIVRVTSPGFQEAIRKVRVGVGVTVRKRIRLKWAALVKKKLPSEKSAQVGKKKFYQTWWFWTIVGVAVVGTTAGAVAGASGGGGSHGKGDVKLSVNPQNAWQDTAVQRSGR